TARSWLYLYALPGLELHLRRIPRDAVQLLDVRGELCAPPADEIQLLLGDAPPALPHALLVMLPVPGDALPVHRCSFGGQTPVGASTAAASCSTCASACSTVAALPQRRSRLQDLSLRTSRLATSAAKSKNAPAPFGRRRLGL